MNSTEVAAGPQLERVADRIERICEEIDRLLADLRAQARQMKERGIDGAG